MSVMPRPGVRNVIKNVFDVHLHHDPIKVSVEEDSNAKNDGLLAFSGQYSKLMGDKYFSKAP
jgi:hypothetical protein